MPDDSPEPALCFNAWEAASVGLTPDRCSNLGAAGTLLDRTLPEVVATGRSPTRLQANGVTSAAQEAAASVDDSAEQQDQGRDPPGCFQIGCLCSSAISGTMHVLDYVHGNDLAGWICNTPMTN